MKLQTFFDKFERFADTPNAVQKMRELVRSLAIRGKLVEQDPSDESVILLLKNIADHKAAVATGRARVETDISKAILDDGDFEIPPTWKWVRFGNLVINWDGERIPVSREERETKAKIYDYYGASGVIDKIDGYLFKKPLLLIGEDGANLISRSTPIAFIARGKYWVNNHAHVLDGISEDFLRFIELYINAISLEPYVTGSAQPKMNQAKMNGIPVALPPLAEQKRIVAKVDELMALCDRLEAQQNERQTRHAALARAAVSRFADAPTPADLDFIFHNAYAITPADLRKTILTLAVQGRLAPQDPNDEPADSILQATQSLFQRLVAAKELSPPKPLPTIEDGEATFLLPNGWAWCRLGQVIRISSGDSLIAKDMNEGPFPVYGGNGVNGYHDEHNVAKRTLVIGRVGFYCGSIHVTPEKAWVTDNAFIATFDEEHVDMDFLSWLLKATDLRERDNATAQPVISGGKVYPTILALPPLAEQRRIVAKVDELMKLVDQLEAQLAASTQQAEQLMQAIVAELTAPRGQEAA